jgi:hypothetical protein
MFLSEFCIKNPKSKAGFYAPVKEGLRDYIVPIIDEVFSDCPDDLVPTLDSHMTLTFNNRSSIIFRGSNNQQHRIRRGNDLQIAGIDEARDVDDLDSLIDSVIIPSLFKTSGRLLISSTPADTEDHPLFQIMSTSQREGWMSHYTIYDANKFDPEIFPLDRIEMWKRETFDKVAWEREYMAKWVKDPTKIIIPEWDDKFIHHGVRDKYFPYYHKYVSMDLGVRDKTAAIFGYYDFLQAKIIIESEFVLKDAEVRTDKIAELVKMNEHTLGYQLYHDKKLPQYEGQQFHELVFRRIADNNNPLLLTDLNAMYHLDFFGTGKGALNSHGEVPGMINLLREWVNDGRVLVSPKCPELLGCLRNAIWDKNKKQLARSVAYGHFDALMALVYLVRNVDISSNPIPKFFEKSFFTHGNIPLVNQISTNSYTLARAFNVKSDTQKARDNFLKGRIGGFN